MVLHNVYNVAKNIRFYNRAKQTSSGFTCDHPSEETKRKLSEARIGKTLSEETKRKMSEAKIGKPRPPRSEEHKRKMSEVRTGRRWIFNSELKTTTLISANEPIPDGWSLGRKLFK